MRATRSSNQAFPVSLYASLLVAMLCLVRPDAVRRVQSWAAAVQSLPLRVVGGVGVPRSADGDDPGSDPAFAAARVDALWDRRAIEAARRPPDVPAELTPLAIAVRARTGAERAKPTRLVLDLPREALDAAADFVTRGDALVGFVDRSNRGPAGDPLAAYAQVALLPHRERGQMVRRVPATIVTADRALGVVVEPAAAIDRWPLRCVLPEDPYFAAGLSGSGLPIRTSGLADDPLGALPAGLDVGTLRIHGYTTESGRVLPIGLFAAPAVAAASIDSVVVWLPNERSVRSRPRALAAADLCPVRARWLPIAGVARERLFVTTVSLRDAALPSGAALVDGERLLGVLDTAGFGFGAVVRFGEPGRPWPITLLPADGGAPIECVIRGVATTRDRAILSCDPPLDGFVRGDVFSGADGLELPGGLWIGPAVAQGAQELVVEILDPATTVDLRVHRHRPLRAEGGR